MKRKTVKYKSRKKLESLKKNLEQKRKGIIKKIESNKIKLKQVEKDIRGIELEIRFSPID